MVFASTKSTQVDGADVVMESSDFAPDRTDSMPDAYTHTFLVTYVAKLPGTRLRDSLQVLRANVVSSPQPLTAIAAPFAETVLCEPDDHL